MIHLQIEASSKDKWKELITKLMPKEPSYEFADQFNEELRGQDMLIFFTDRSDELILKKVGNRKETFVFFLAYKGKEPPQDIQRLPNFAGVIFEDGDYDGELSLLTILTKYYENNIRFRDFLNLEVELDNQVRIVKDQKEKLKKLYRKLVPLRVHHYKNLTLTSKFLAGNGPGGEFFDYSVEENKISIFGFSSSESDQLINFLSFFEKKNFEKFEGFENSDLFRCDIELSTLRLHIFKKGELSLLLEGEWFQEDSHQLRPGEDFYILSKGLLKNFRDKAELLELIRSLKKTVSREDLFDEVFLKARGDSEYLPFDAFMMNVKVGEHALFKV